MTSGGFPYRVNRGLILHEIKIGQGTKADGTHVGRRKMLQGAAKRCRGLLSKWSTLRRALHPRCHGMSRARAVQLADVHRNFSRAPNTPPTTPHSPATVSCGRDDMTVNGEVKPQAIDRDVLRRGLVTSSTKLRIESLGRLEYQVTDECRCIWNIMIVPALIGINI